MSHEEPAFKIKNATVPMFVLHVHSTDLERLKSELAARLSQTPGFFLGSPMLINLAGIAESAETPDLTALVAFMRQQGMQAVGAMGGSPAQREAAVLAGLAIFPEISERRIPARQVEEVVAPAAVVEHVAQVAVPVETPVVASTVDAPRPILRPTVVIDKPVRTGQRIYVEDGHLVVLAIVNAGAELIADGDIHVYAPLRGRAIAGAHGNQDARIYVQRMEAELVSIAGCFQVFDQGVPEHVRDKAAQIHLDGSKLILEPLAG